MKSLLEYHGINKTQAEVDFVIPFLDLDRRYFLDPSLLHFSTLPLAKRWDNEIREFLRLIRQIIRSGNKEKFRSLLNIGEANDIGLGYCAKGTDGSGFGKKISENIEQILAKNPEFQKRGFTRLEELQWLDKNIGADRVSDFAVHILKRDIIKYTKRQCVAHGIPTELVRVGKVFHPDTLSWRPLETKVPINPLKKVRDALNPHPPLLLIPKRFLRPLPLFLNYHDLYGFIKTEDDLEVDSDLSLLEKSKSDVVKYIVRHPEKSIAYINSAEQAPEEICRQEFDSEALVEIERLDTLVPGHGDANQYRDAVGKILDFLFDDLALFDTENSSAAGDLRRDLVFRNEAQSGIFYELKRDHNAKHIVVDAKNKEKITPEDISRAADYLNDNVGRVAFIVSRKDPDKGEIARLRKHAATQLKDQNKVFLFISDADLKSWVKNKTRIEHVTEKPHLLYDPETSIKNKYSMLLTS